MSDSIAHVETCIAQVTLRLIDSLLLTYNFGLYFPYFVVFFKLAGCKYGLYNGANVWAKVFELFLYNVGRLLVFKGDDNGNKLIWFLFRVVRCVTLVDTKFVMVKLIRLRGYFSRTNTSLRRLHSSEKYAHEDDSR